jgi:SAM-dependent methyltransferase
LGKIRAMAVRYDNYRSAIEGFVPYLERLIERTAAKRVCDLGGGARPSLSLAAVQRLGLDYVVLDISADELAKAPAEYATVQSDIAGDQPPDLGPQDLVFSRMLAEHIAEPERFHRNVRALLRDDGIAFHLFPTLYELPFLVNRLLPVHTSERFLVRLDPARRREGRKPKFPAYYRWCRGPHRRQLRRFERLGYAVEEYVGFFGHDYLAKVAPIQRLEDRLAAALLRHPVPYFTSYAYLVLRRVP